MIEKTHFTDHALVCMNCGHPNIFYLHCKIRCTNCGFTLDCSDLDVGGEVQRASQKSHQVLRSQAPTFPDTKVSR